jgi:hypothetical protein
VQDLGWDHADIIALVHCYIDSEWCENGRGAFAGAMSIWERIEAVDR